MSKSDWWCSPPLITEPLAEFFHGPVDIDPCSNERSIVKARLAYTEGGLVLPWRLAKPVGWSGYQNDPYSQGEIWTYKMLHEMNIGNLREHVRLCMMATSSAWWRDQCLLARRNPRILALKRVPFLDPYADEPGEQRAGSRFEPALLYWGHRPKQFDRAFARMTRWTTWGRS